MMEKQRTPMFEIGDRVKLWGKSREVGTVDEMWFDGPNEIVTVIWEVSGCASEVRAHRLQFALSPPVGEGKPTDVGRPQLLTCPSCHKKSSVAAADISWMTQRGTPFLCGHCNHPLPMPYKMREAQPVAKADTPADVGRPVPKHGSGP